MQGFIPDDAIKDDNVLFELQPRIRQCFSQHDVIYVQGHEHQYQRPLIAATSSLLRFSGSRVDYTSYYAEHRAKSNASEYAFNPKWQLLDKFSRNANRCELVIYPMSVPTRTRVSC